MTLLSRIHQIRNNLPTEQTWQSLKETHRYECIRKLINTDENKNVSFPFVKAYKIATGKAMIEFDFDYDKLINIFDLAEKYAKNWIFT